MSHSATKIQSPRNVPTSRAPAGTSVAVSRKSYRLWHAVAFGLVAGLVAFRAQFLLHGNAGDHLTFWNAARMLVTGGDPYAHPATAMVLFYYPLPAVVFGLPFAWLPPEPAAFAFTLVSGVLFGFVVARGDYRYLPLVLSMPFLASAQMAQTSTLVTAAALVPAVSGLAFLKPNLGLAFFAKRPTWRMVLLPAVLCVVALAVNPHWPLEWLRTVRSSPVHHAPFGIGIGAVGLLALVRWRDPAARFVAVMTMVPQGLLFYDQLPLGTVIETTREAMVFTVATWMGWVGWMLWTDGSLKALWPWAVSSSYLAATAIVLVRWRATQSRLVPATTPEAQ